MNEKYDVHAHHVLPSRTLYRDNIEKGEDVCGRQTSMMRK